MRTSGAGHLIVTSAGADDVGGTVLARGKGSLNKDFGHRYDAMVGQMTITAE